MCHQQRDNVEAATCGLPVIWARNVHYYRVDKCVSVWQYTHAPSEGDETSGGEKMNTRNTELENTLAQIAATHCNVKTLKTRHSDSLDFIEVSVWGLKAALEAAFAEGLAAAQE
jgi:hypothetical protein